MHKNQENMTCNQSTEIDPGMTEMMELTNKNVKTAIIIMRQIFRQVEEMVNIMGREMEDMKKAQVELREMEME